MTPQASRTVGAGTRPLRYGIVATAGFVIQFAVLAVGIRLGVLPVVAAALAIEAAILHNFAWHDAWTFRDRRNAGPAGTLARLVRYNTAMGVTSMGAGVLATWTLTGALGLSAAVASVAGVMAAAILNYLVSDRVVFTLRRGRRRPGPAVRRPTPSSAA